MVVLEDLKYSKDHLWIKKETELVRIGITDFAQKELGELLYVDLPEKDSIIIKSNSFATVESAKTVTDVIAPFTGKIIEVNNQLTDHPETVNIDPFEKGWLIIVKVDNLAEIDSLLTYNEYLLGISS
ncbi:MAG: glycine cleavage system protein GcvH [bacterium]